MFTYWAMMLSVSGMYTMYLIQAGFSKTDISVAVTISTFSGLVGQNLIGYLADRFRHAKKVLFLTISAGIFFAAALIFARQVWQIDVLIAVWAFFVYGSVPLSEAYCIGFLKTTNEQSNFGKIRGLGSIGYGLSGVLIGVLLQSFGWKVYSWYILVSVVIALISVLMLKDLSGTELKNNMQEASASPISFREALKETISLKPLRSIIIIVFMYNFVVKGIYSYLGVLVSDFGGGPLSLGFTYFFDASPEIVTFFLTARLMQKYHSKWLIMIAFLLQLVRLSLILVFNSSLAIILLGVLSGSAYGLLATAYKTYIYELLPDKYKISCLSLSESIISFSGVISVPVFGFALLRFGGPATIAMGIVINLAALLLIIKDLYKQKAKGIVQC